MKVPNCIFPRMNTKKNLLTMVCLMLAMVCQAQKQLFNEGWLFHYGDGDISRMGALQGWEQVSLPHDWSMHMPFSEKNASGNDGGYLPTGTGWYKKTFSINDPHLPDPDSDEHQMGLSSRYELYFEGVYMNSTVYVNGDSVGGHPYGYSSFFCDITDAVRNGENTVAVRVDNSMQKNCRWYTGSGIYRNVWLMRKPCVGIDNWGVQITTPTESEVHVVTTLYNATDCAAEPTLVTRIGKYMQVSKDVPVEAHSSRAIEQVFSIGSPRLWSPDRPALYTATVEVMGMDSNGRDSVVDRSSQKFGIRTIDYDAVNGFLLNGKPVKLNGGCLHHDNGLLGAAAWDDAEVRKVRLMKAAGYNAARTSHNPPSEAFLDACDSLGLLVIDEAFDGWREAKNKYDYHTLFDKWYKDDIKKMVCRDRNHPSIVCWSVGNEIIERKTREAVATAYQLREQVHRWDATRPITSALAAWDKDWEIYDPLASAQDIVGYNYMMHKAEGDHQRVPGRVMWQTESYPRDAYKNWKRCMAHPYIIGDFVWTSLDYIGESGIGRYWYDGDPAGEHYQRALWPWHAAYCGDIDLTGCMKPIGHYRSLLWNGNDDGRLMYMAVREPDGYKGKIRTGLWATWPTVESWNWEGWEGKNIDVVVYSREPQVSLYLNGKLVGTKAVADSTEYKAVFRLPYQPGVLKAVAGREEQTIRTAGTPKKMILRADVCEGGLSFIDVWIVDNDGNVCPTANTDLTFEVEGGELLAAGNADIKDPTPYYDNVHKVWHGHALAIVRRTAKADTSATLTVTGKGLKPARINIAK